LTSGARPVVADRLDHLHAVAPVRTDAGEPDNRGAVRRHVTDLDDELGSAVVVDFAAQQVPGIVGVSQALDANSVATNRTRIRSLEHRRSWCTAGVGVGGVPSSSEVAE
jgi:hypothetical protein